MSKFKISSGLAAVVLLVSLFAGWSTLLLVTVLMLLFCEISEEVKKVMISVITFFAALTLFSMAWGIVVDGVSLVVNSLKSLIGIINTYLSNPINIFKLETNVIHPVTTLVDLADNIVSYLVVLAKFGFVIAILSNRPMKENFVVKKINGYISKFVNYINTFEVSINNVQQSNVQEQTVDSNVNQING